MGRSRAVIAGVDGCKAGWLRVYRDIGAGELHFDVSSEAEELFGRQPLPDVLGIDIPIGLTDAGPRECDRLARRLLGRPRSSSVFPAPIRPALGARSRLEASRIREAVDGSGVGAQAFNLYARIRDIDAVLRARPELRGRVREVHPEVSFRALNGGQAIVESKKTGEGRRKRQRLLAAYFGSRALAAVGAAFRRGEVADDDVLDALAVLWTAERVYRGEAVTLPDDPPRDAAGLAMEIVY